MMKLKSKFSGFTLAEVLIVLGIIGVVVAMTLPTLINKVQKQEYVTALKKDYSQINQALNQMALDDAEAGNLASLFDDKNGYIASIKSHFKIVKNCGFDTSEDCFSSFSGNVD